MGIQESYIKTSMTDRSIRMTQLLYQRSQYQTVPIVQVTRTRTHTDTRTHTYTRTHTNARTTEFVFVSTCPHSTADRHLSRQALPGFQMGCWSGSAAVETI